MLYKYTDEKFINSLINDGMIRIGTLHDYKEVEKYGDAVGDKKEGQIILTKYFQDYQATKEKDDKLLSKFGIISIKNPETVVEFENVRFTKQINSNNCYVFCLSRRLNSNIAQAFSTNSCVEITDVLKFAEKVTETLFKLGLVERSYIISPIVYIQNPGTDLDIPDINPELVKEFNYSYQEEVRIIWPVLKPGEVEPQLINVGSLRDIVKEVNIREDFRSSYNNTIFKNIHVTKGTWHFINPILINSKFENCTIVIDSFSNQQSMGVSFINCNFVLGESINIGIQSLINLSKIKSVRKLLANDISKIIKELRT